MRKIWKESFWYNIGRYYVDFCTRASFSSVKVEGKENIPSRGAVMFAPNHRCALMDALLMLLIDHRPIGFGARMDIFRKPRITTTPSTKFPTALPTECRSACSARARTGPNPA